jgi:hypothetical protein
MGAGAGHPEAFSHSCRQHTSQHNRAKSDQSRNNTRHHDRHEKHNASSHAHSQNTLGCVPTTSACHLATPDTQCTPALQSKRTQKNCNRSITRGPSVMGLYNKTGCREDPDSFQLYSRDAASNRTVTHPVARATTHPLTGVPLQKSGGPACGAPPNDAGHGNSRTQLLKQQVNAGLQPPGRRQSTCP